MILNALVALAPSHVSKHANSKKKNTFVKKSFVDCFKKVKFLSDVKSGGGTRFLETRVMKGRESTTELEVTEFVESEHVRIVSNKHGTIWDTVFIVKTTDGHTELTMTMNTKPYKFLPKIKNPMIKGMLMKALEDDMDIVNTICEKLTG